MSDPTRLLLIAQLVIQVVLIAFVVFLLVLEKRRRLGPDFIEELKAVVNQSRDLSRSFQEHVQQRVDVLGRVISELDAKVRSAELLMKALEETSVRVKQARQFGQADVRKLHQGGYEPVEISQITGIPVGEVQLMIKVGSTQS